MSLFTHAIAVESRRDTFEEMSAKFSQAIEAARGLSEDQLDELADRLSDLIRELEREERYRHARTLEGLAEAERGEGFNEAQARRQMTDFLDALRQQRCDASD